MLLLSYHVEFCAYVSNRYGMLSNLLNILHQLLVASSTQVESSSLILSAGAPTFGGGTSFETLDFSLPSYDQAVSGDVAKPTAKDTSKDDDAAAKAAEKAAKEEAAAAEKAAKEEAKRAAAEKKEGVHASTLLSSKTSV